jgi:hypothetical protein
MADTQTTPKKEKGTDLTGPEAGPLAAAGAGIDGSLRFGVQYKTHYFEIAGAIPTTAGEPWAFEVTEGADRTSAHTIVGVKVQGKNWYAAVKAPDGALKFGQNFEIAVLQIGVAHGLSIPDSLEPATNGKAPDNGKKPDPPVDPS